ncbi:mitochondrial carrier [Macrolepiota fuliginosa MF-IS2]|uniref:Mitochondrial carrier n=1 Tax=Macrolepiota fuliginosa MF-IS2 TaxID=1400762 RepID=A0A9P6CA43_9AGAR|nr:mitochondrial carrier [Macrolepiota fuliginosa MF-IS2]
MDPFHAKLVAAATGSTITALTMTPFDVIKTRLQTQPVRPQPLFPVPPPNTCCLPAKAELCVRNMSSLARSMSSLARPLSGEVVCIWHNGVIRTEQVNGFYDAARHVWRAEGIRGLWKGAGTSLVMGVPSATAYILTYDHLLNVVLPTVLPAGPVLPLSAGIIARSAITSLVSPLELIRTNLQSTPLSPNNPHTLRSVLTSVHNLVQQNGVLFLWRGLGPTLWRDVPFSGLYWASYEGWKSFFARRGYEGASVAFVSGAASGIISALITSPFDVLKTRRQALIMSASNVEFRRTIPLLLRIVRTEGVPALFAGILPRVVKIAPACGIMISCFEGIGKLLSRPSP